MSKPLTDTYLSEIEARLNAATPGPWEIKEHCVMAPNSTSQNKTLFFVDDFLEVDVILASHAPADISALLAEVRRLRAEQPVCPYCHERMTVCRHEGYYDDLNYWGCDCDNEDLSDHVVHTFKGGYVS